MRALCGSIITAGAFIGLGLSAIGLGTRYHDQPMHDLSGEHWVRFRDLDTSLMVVLVVLLIGACIGLCIAFAGLAYHHHRRHLEILHRQVQQPQDFRPV